MMDSGKTGTGWQRTTWTGVEIDIRTARPDDEPILTELFRNVSPEDLRFRFLSGLSHVPPEQIRRMTHVDHETAESYIAFLRENQLPVATGMLAADPTGKRAEVAISLHADYRQRGIGWEMLSFLSEQAEARGIEVIESIESRDNRAALEVERNMDFKLESIPGDSTLVLVSKRLGSGKTAQP